MNESIPSEYEIKKISKYRFEIKTSPNTYWVISISPAQKRDQVFIYVGLGLGILDAAIFRFLGEYSGLEAYSRPINKEIMPVLKIGASNLGLPEGMPRKEFDDLSYIKNHFISSPHFQRITIEKYAKLLTDLDSPFLWIHANPPELYCMVALLRHLDVLNNSMLQLPPEKARLAKLNFAASKGQQLSKLESHIPEWLDENPDLLKPEALIC